MKEKLVFFVIITIVVLIVSSVFLFQNTNKQSSPPPQPWFICKTDSDCVPNMESWVCCSNTIPIEDFHREMMGFCPEDRFAGFCTCNVPKGHHVGVCNGLISRVTTTTNGMAKSANVGIFSHWVLRLFIPWLKFL